VFQPGGVALSLRTSCDSLCQARSDYCFAMVKEASADPQPTRSILVPSS